MGRSCTFSKEEPIPAVATTDSDDLVSTLHLQLSELQSMLIDDHHRSTAEAAAGARRRMTVMERLREIAKRLGLGVFGSGC